MRQPPANLDDLLGRRVRQYEVAMANNKLTASLVHTFGETTGAGVLRVVESIYAGPHLRLGAARALQVLVADVVAQLGGDLLERRVLAA